MSLEEHGPASPKRLAISVLTWGGVDNIDARHGA